jgi:hypothetical protein
MMHASNASSVELAWKRVLSGLFHMRVASYTSRNIFHVSLVGHHSASISQLNPFAFLTGYVHMRNRHHGDAPNTCCQTVWRQIRTFNLGVTK